ncbi:hypothetical protein BaRGS_00035372 [Batillaria attramentaria]|uniref:Uncharacterized protein n=1 Tax=Batillaria attramentaria TaxID=370345 RepID=A0ABD0JF58_9CAEN
MDFEGRQGTRLHFWHCAWSWWFAIMHKIKPRYTTKELLRFPLVFGAVLGVFITGFMYRKVYFGEEIEAVRLKNYQESLRRKDIMDRAKEAANEQVLARTKSKTE